MPNYLRRRSAALAVLLSLALLSIAACGEAPAGEISPAAEATIAALTVENERLTTELAALQANAAAGEGDLLGAMLEQNPQNTASAAVGPDAESTAAEAPVVAVAIDSPVTTPTALPSPLPPPTPLPTFVPEALGETPPAGRFAPEDLFANSWGGDFDRQQTLGWALTETTGDVPIVVQSFERGVMIWRSDTQQIYALWNHDDGQRWRAFEDTFTEGEPETDPALTVPDALLQPERGFGKVWRQNPQLRSDLGWALAKERREDARIQPFERGLMAYISGRVYGIGQTPAGATTWFQE